MPVTKMPTYKAMILLQVEVELEAPTALVASRLAESEIEDAINRHPKFSMTGFEIQDTEIEKVED